MALYNKVLMISAVMAAAFVVVATIKCQRPWSAEDCARIRVKCRALNESICAEEGGTYYPRGGFCNYCDICGIYVGYNERCNVTMEGKTYASALCEPEYVCSGGINGTCVRPEECTY